MEEVLFSFVVKRAQVQVTPSDSNERELNKLVFFTSMIYLHCCCVLTEDDPSNIRFAELLNIAIFSAFIVVVVIAKVHKMQNDCHRPQMQA